MRHGPHSPEGDSGTHTELTEVATGVYAYVQPDGGWCLNNAGFIRGPEGVVVIDTAATERRARRLKAAVDTLAPPGRYAIINTHHHGDHVFGNCVFPKSTTIIAHERARKEILDTGFALTELWPDVRWGDISLRLPTVTFVDRMNLWIGDRLVELHHVGPAHTTNDTVVWLPDERVLFAGDVLLNGCTPFMLMGSIRGSLAALRRLREFEAETIVCGHGPVCGPEIITRTEEYLCWIDRLARQGERDGLTPLELAWETDLGQYAEWLDPERIVGNLHRAYTELDTGELGRPLDVASVFSEMVTYNGGELPVCRA